ERSRPSDSPPPWRREPPQRKWATEVCRSHFRPAEAAFYQDRDRELANAYHPTIALLYTPGAPQALRNTTVFPANRFARAALVATARAVSTDLKARDDDVKPAIAFQLVLQRLESLAHELGDLSAAQAGHVNMITPQLPLVVMSLAVQVHQVKLVDQSLPLQKVQGAVNRASVYRVVYRARLAENLAGVQMLGRCLDDAQNCAALRGHANSAAGKLCLQMAWNLSVRQWHSQSPVEVASDRKKHATKSLGIR